MVCHTDVEGFRPVMPVKAGIQRDSALASCYTSQIPGLAVLARNDVPAGYPFIFTVVVYLFHIE